MGLTVTSFNNALKHLYTAQRLENMVYKRNPFHAMVPKMESFGGIDMPIPIVFSNPQGRSRTFATAQTKSTAATGSTTSVNAFFLTRVKDYGVAVIDNEAMEASEGNAAAFMAARKVEIDGIINALARSLATAEFRLGYGRLAAVGAFVDGASSTITVSFTGAAGGPIDEITNFEVGMDLVAASLESSGVLRSATTLTVTNVNRTTGVITVNGSVVTNWTGFAVGDILFINGDRDNLASPGISKVAGLEAWLPATAPTSTAYFGVDRSQDTRLGGLRLARAGYPLEEALVDAMALVAREGGQPDKALTNFANYANIEKALGAKVQYLDLKVNGTIAFPGIRVNGPAGYVDLVADQNCPPQRIFVLELDSFKLCSLGKAPKIIGSDGLEMIRQSNADGVEIRVGYYANLACDAPGYNCNIQVS